jgi:hypothetical protein
MVPWLRVGSEVKSTITRSTAFARPGSLLFGLCLGQSLAGRGSQDSSHGDERLLSILARNVRTGTPRPRRFEPLTTDEARKGELLGLGWADLNL